MDTKMTDLGMTRKALHGSEGRPAEPMSEKDWENQKVYPCLRASGKQAELLGAESLEEGELVRQEVVWKVAKRRKVEEGGKVDYELELEMVKGSDLTSEGMAKEEGESSDDEGADSPSPAMRYIAGMASGGDED